MNFNFLDKLYKKKRPKYLYLLLISVTLFSCVSIQGNLKEFNEYSFYAKHYKYMTPEAYTLIKKWSKKRNVEMALVSSQIEYESADHYKTKYNWDKMKRVHSPSNAIGVMQLLSKYHGGKDWRSLYNPDINIQRGTMYLKICLNKAQKENWKSPLRQALRYYNAGTGNKIHNYKNWKYVNKIMKKYNKVKEELFKVSV